MHILCCLTNIIPKVCFYYGYWIIIVLCFSKLWFINDYAYISFLNLDKVGTFCKAVGMEVWGMTREAKNNPDLPLDVYKYVVYIYI